MRLHDGQIIATGEELQKLREQFPDAFKGAIQPPRLVVRRINRKHEQRKKLIRG